MKAALVAEYRKFVSTRMWWVLLIAMVGYLAFIGAVLAFSMTAEDAMNQPVLLSGGDLARSIYALTSPIGYVFALVIGSLAVTGEFRHKTITASLLVEPRRGVLLSAKLIAGIPIGALYGILGTLAVVATVAPILAILGDGAFLGDGSTIEVIALSMLVMVLWTAMGVAFGAVVSNQVAAIVILLAFTQLVEPIARIALASFDATTSVSKFLPGSAADALVGTTFFASMGEGASDLLPQWAGAVVMLVYIAAFAVVGRLTTLRRDVA
ncbi:ABC transporter permease subunit [Gordonia amicalis]|uniref:ABC transporter permease subunit n=1 Tax=Gordonia amicalis TaxID=89053 RepID=A0ABU4DD24_9ACTN|nr:ABC transporter permease subunit [Gordonia amicalis]MDV6307642.1 ABC transporter permease subunit [Gordonia amicalis]MDV7099403.1 ABC transporter permease subunit [Gordonia amicalis]UKO92405.1 ABC transporter permease [Gordonia amicalis]